MEQECRVMGVEKELLRKSSSEVISFAIVERLQGGKTLTDRLFQAVEMQFAVLAINVARDL